MDAVTQFYQTDLANREWSLLPGNVQSDETVIVRYQQDATTATVMVKKDPATGSMVWITLFTEQ